MKCTGLLVANICLLAACATTTLPEDRPVLVRGTVTNLHGTDWVRDWCGYHQPVLHTQASGSPSCIPLGGELYRADLKFGQVVGGGRLGTVVKIAFPGHAFTPSYVIRDYFVILPAPSNFRAATGLRSIVGDVGDYDPANACIVDNGYSHIDLRECKDPAYHDRNNGHCVPIAEYLSHYAAER